MRQIFKDASNQQCFKDNGYVIIKEALPLDSISVLYNYFKENQNSYKTLESSYTNIEIGNPILNDQLQNKLVKLVESNLCTQIKDLMLNYRAVFCTLSYINKKPNSGVFGVHPHPFLVDVRKYKTIIAWIPLVKVFKENGTLQLIPNSYSDYIFNYDQSQREEHSEIAELNIGDILLFDTKLHHWSDTNRTDQDRLVLVLPFIPEEAQLVSHVLREENDKTFVDIFDYNAIYTYSNFTNKEVFQNKTPLDSFQLMPNIRNKKRDFSVTHQNKQRFINVVWYYKLKKYISSLFN